MKTESKQKENLPGEYPPQEDIFARSERVDGDVEDLIENKSPNTSLEKPKKSSRLSAEGNKPFEDDEDLKKRTTPADFTGSDLDVPGAELDDDEEEIGSEDEENNLYSLGGDNHDNDDRVD